MNDNILFVNNSIYTLCEFKCIKLSPHHHPLYDLFSYYIHFSGDKPYDILAKKFKATTCLFIIFGKGDVCETDFRGLFTSLYIPHASSKGSLNSLDGMWVLNVTCHCMCDHTNLLIISAPSVPSSAIRA